MKKNKFLHLLKNYWIKLNKKFFIESLILLILGGLTSLSLPPFNFFFINFFTFSIFFSFLIKKLKFQTNKKFFFYYGWLFGFGYFLASLYWITISLTFDKDLNFLIPIGIILVPSFLAIFYGLVTLILYLYDPRNLLSAFFFIFILVRFYWIYSREYFNRLPMEFDNL